MRTVLCEVGRACNRLHRVLHLLQVIAPALNELSANMADTLSIGSYPVSAQRDGAGIVISLEGALSCRGSTVTSATVPILCPATLT